MNKAHKIKLIGYFLVAIIFLAIGIGVTYSYLAIKINGIESKSTIGFDSGLMQIDYENNSSDLVLDKIIPGAEVTKKFTLTGTNNTKNNKNITDNNMYYKIGIVIDYNTFSQEALKYELTKDSSSTSNGKQADNLNGYIAQSGTNFIGNGYFTGEAKSAKHIYNLTISFPETNMDQNVDQGAIFAAHIIIEQDRELNDYSNTGIEFLTELYNSEEENSYGLKKDLTSDENIRYSGADPQNYVEFGNEGELWRIVGIFKIKDNEKSGYKNKIKIVRNDSLGNYSWDARLNNQTNDYRGINDWNTASLMKELNGSYLDYTLIKNENWYNNYWQNNQANQRQSAIFNYNYTIKEKYQNLISESVWNTGGNTYTYINSTEATIPTLGQYNAERGNSLYTSDTINNVTRTSTWTGKVGLIYASDFGYTSSDQECQNDLRAGQVYNSSTGNYNYDSAKCKKDNWLHRGSWYWTMSPYSNDSSINFIVYGEGIVSNNYAYISSGVYPAIYLKTDTKIISGTGTKTDPYHLA